MDDLSGIQIGAGAFGVVSVSALLMVLLQRVKSYYPTLEGRGAEAACDGLAFIVALLVVGQTNPDWREGTTWLAVGMGTLSLGIVARGMYSSLFHVAVEGVPPGPDAEVAKEDVTEPYDAEPRKPIAYTRPMTDDELTDVARRRP